MVNLFHRYMEYERDSKDILLAVLASGHALFFFVTNYQCWIGCCFLPLPVTVFASQLNQASWWILCVLSFANQSYSISVCWLLTLVRIVFCPVLSWHLELLYDFLKWFTSVVFSRHGYQRPCEKKTWIESKLTNHIQPLWSDRILRITFLLHWYILSIGKSWSQIILYKSHSLNSWWFMHLVCLNIWEQK